jgi:RNA polymerase sigma-70 factor, ECF subfamily
MSPGVNEDEKFLQMCELYRRLVQHVIYRVVDNPAVVEDLTQDVFVIALQRRETLSDTAALRGWLCKIARNRAKNYISREHIDDIPIDDVPEDDDLFLPPEDTDRPERDILLEQIRSRLEAALATACPNEIDYLVLALVLKGEKPEEVATQLDMKPSTCRSHLRRSRRRFLAHLIVHDPDLLGGTASITEAIEKAAKQGPCLEADEGDALLRVYTRLLVEEIAAGRSTTGSEYPGRFAAFMSGLAVLLGAEIPLPARLQNRYVASFGQSIGYVNREVTALPPALQDVLFAAYVAAVWGAPLAVKEQQRLRAAYTREVEGKAVALKLKSGKLCNQTHLESACWKISDYLHPQMSIVVAGR